MGGGGAISGMQASLKMNDRRVPREHFKKTPGMKPEPTSYNVPTVSQFKRDAIVREILAKRRIRNRIGWIFAFLCTAGCFVYFVFG